MRALWMAFITQKSLLAHLRTGCLSAAIRDNYAALTPPATPP